MANTGGSACACRLDKQLKALCKSKVSSLLPQTLALQSCCDINGRSGLEPHTHSAPQPHPSKTLVSPTSAVVLSIVCAEQHASPYLHPWYSTTGQLWLYIFYHRTIMSVYILPQDHYDSPSTALSFPLRLFCYPTATELFLFCLSVLNNKSMNFSFWWE